MPYQVPRGMRDILPEEVGRWQALEQRIRALAERFGFRELRTPVVEHTEVFARTSGEESDLVQREMYTFTDRRGRAGAGGRRRSDRPANPADAEPGAGAGGGAPE